MAPDTERENRSAFWCGSFSEVIQAMSCTENEGFSPVAIDHGRNPRNYGPLREFNGHGRVTGPCGDTMEMWLLVRKGRLDRTSFTTDGCVSSLACGSMTTVLAQHKVMDDLARLSQRDILEALGAIPARHRHCALLAVNTLKAACADFTRRRDAVQENGEAGGETSQTKPQAARGVALPRRE